MKIIKLFFFTLNLVNLISCTPTLAMTDLKSVETIDNACYKQAWGITKLCVGLTGMFIVSTKLMGPIHFEKTFSQFINEHPLKFIYNGFFSIGKSGYSDAFAGSTLTRAQALYYVQKKSQRKLSF